MTDHRLLALTAVSLLVAWPALAQHEAQQPAASGAAALAQCGHVQPVVQQMLDTATATVEAARQSNSAAALRSAASALDATLRDLRIQLAACASVPTSDAHAGHGAPPAAAPAADAHAGHDAAATGQTGEAQAIDTWLNGYDAAFNAKDLARLATYYHPDVTIFEGAGVNNGWADYRDRHLGPELKSFADLQFGHSNRRVQMLGDRAAYVTSEYFIKAKMGDRLLDNIGRETLIVEKQADGSWKIRHSHTSGRARPQPK